MPRLHVTEISSIGAVDSGDNPEAEIVLFKRNPDTGSKVTDDRPDRASNRKVTDVSDDALSELEKRNQSLEDEKAALETQLAELTEKAEQASKDVEKRDSDVAELQKRLEDVEKARAYDLAFAKAADTEILGDPAEAAPHIQALQQVGESFDWLWAKVQDVNALVNKSALFKQAGTGDPGDAVSQVEALAKTLQQSDPKLTEAQARILARKQRPDLKALEREER